MTTQAPPKGEFGVPSDTIGGGFIGGVMPWRTFMQSMEHVPDLIWPTSIPVYHKMRTDAQVDGLLAGLFWPIASYNWCINPNGADEKIVESISESLRLPIKGEEEAPRGRLKDRFDFGSHLRHALLSLVYGHMFFEQVGEIGDDDLFQLRKLAPRMPESIGEIALTDSGGLYGIRQTTGRGNEQPKMLLENRLVAYVWDKEGANWAGRSIFRSLYRHWVLKDILLRVDVSKHERGGMGIPVYENPQGATPSQIKAGHEMVDQLKAGETGGISHAAGGKLRLVGVEGSLPDTIGSVIYHDQQMARRLVGMVMSYGQQGSTGNRALGDTALEMFDRGQDYIATFFENTFNEHVIEDIVDWNWGTGTKYVPVLEHTPPEDPAESVRELADLVNKNVITMDEELEAWVRHEQGYPEAAPSPGGGAALLARKGSRGRRGSAPTPISAAATKPRREPSDVEVKAAFDPDALDKTYLTALDEIVGIWSDQVRPLQIADLERQIAKTDDLKALAELVPKVDGVGPLSDVMRSAGLDAAKGAVAEGKAQGVTLKAADLKKIEARLEGRAEAVARLLAQDLTTAAGRKAVALSGGGLGKAEVASSVRAHLEAFTDAWLRDRIGGAISAAVNAARIETFSAGPPADIYASELLDSSACENCAEVDGTQYDSWEEAEADYPTGGYANCLGGDRCRGTLVAVFADEAEAS